MDKLKTFTATAFGIFLAIVLTPFIAFFGLLMLGLTFGMALLAAGTVAAMARNADRAEQEDVKEEAPTDSVPA